MLRTFALRAALALGLLSAGCASGPRFDYQKEYDPRAHEYVIGIGDSIAVNVYHNADMSGGGTVRPDGILTLPLVGDLSVAGKTPTQVREEMKKRIATYVKDDSAFITVAVTGVNSYKFVVAGNVGHAGSFSQHYYVTVSEAIAMAGGMGRFAGDDILVLRQNGTGKVREIPVNYAEISSGKHPEEDIAVVAGDTIFVP